MGSPSAGFFPPQPTRSVRRGSVVVADVDVIAVVRQGEGRAGPVDVEAVDQLGGVGRSGQVGERAGEVRAGRVDRGVRAGDAVDGGDVHRPAEVVVGDVAGRGV